MKKINLYLIILLFIILVPISTFAKNDIYTKDAKIYITKDGTAQVTETWDVKGEDGTEWYIPLTNLGESEISNFTVQMDATKYIFIINNTYYRMICIRSILNVFHFSKHFSLNG